MWWYAVVVVLLVCCYNIDSVSGAITTESTPNPAGLTTFELINVGNANELDVILPSTTNECSRENLNAMRELCAFDLHSEKDNLMEDKYFRAWICLPGTVTWCAQKRGTKDLYHVGTTEFTTNTPQCDCELSTPCRALYPDTGCVARVGDRCPITNPIDCRADARPTPQSCPQLNDGQRFCSRSLTEESCVPACTDCPHQHLEEDTAGGGKQCVCTEQPQLFACVMELGDKAWNCGDDCACWESTMKCIGKFCQKTMWCELMQCFAADVCPNLDPSPCPKASCLWAGGGAGEKVTPQLCAQSGKAMCKEFQKPDRCVDTCDQCTGSTLPKEQDGGIMCQCKEAESAIVCLAKNNVPLGPHGVMCGDDCRCWKKALECAQPCAQAGWCAAECAVPMTCPDVVADNACTRSGVYHTCTGSRPQTGGQQAGGGGPTDRTCGQEGQALCGDKCVASCDLCPGRSGTVPTDGGGAKCDCPKADEAIKCLLGKNIPINDDGVQCADNCDCWTTALECVVPCADAGWCASECAIPESCPAVRQKNACTGLGPHAGCGRDQGKGKCEAGKKFCPTGGDDRCIDSCATCVGYKVDDGDECDCTSRADAMACVLEKGRESPEKCEGDCSCLKDFLDCSTKTKCGHAYCDFLVSAVKSKGCQSLMADNSCMKDTSDKQVVTVTMKRIATTPIGDVDTFKKKVALELGVSVYDVTVTTNMNDQLVIEVRALAEVAPSVEANAKAAGKRGEFGSIDVSAYVEPATAAPVADNPLDSGALNTCIQQWVVLAAPLVACVIVAALS